MMMSELDKIDLSQAMLQDRDALRSRLAGKEKLVAVVTNILDQADLAELATTRPGEYRAEAETILLRLPAAENVTELRDLIRAEFASWFDEDTAGPSARYQHVAERIWQVTR